MEKIYTVGGRRLEGELPLSGSKNATLAILAATLLASEGQTVLTNVPQISDVRVMQEMLSFLGVASYFPQPNTLVLDATNLRTHEAPYELIKKMRASFSVLGPILARFGRARVALPGGCDIGARPVDFHLKGLEQMGAQITVEHGFVEAVTPNGLQGAKIYLEFPSVGATTHLMTAAALASGTTTITNCAEEPDVVACADYINSIGGRVFGAGTKVIQIEGVTRLHGATYAVDTDRIEAGTYAVAAAITGGDVFLSGVIDAHVGPAVLKLREIGVEVTFERNGMRVSAPGRHFVAANIKASPHPGFPTDLQPPFAALLTLAQGTSIITETVYERRFKYIDEMCRMGADLKTEGNNAIIRGVARLSGAPVAGSDLRATAALVLAGLAAEGRSEISGIQYLDRGYEDLVGKLSRIGAEIRRANDELPSPMKPRGLDGGSAVPITPVDAEGTR